MDDAGRVARCPRCGAEWLADTPEGLCPACLMAGVVGPSSALTDSELSTLSPGGVSASTLQAGPRLVPGQVFGPYRIGRLLGRGGMGEVYEAEHVEQGRRVALKVLNQRLTGPQDRARFLREGQLAASITHPNSVYIFGSDEIAGTPVIAMELLAGGTLKDRVKEHGPLPPAKAVDAILQVIAGLDAAHAGGVLHRDIKPANCFIDGDHTVKIGDFGLSISTAARDMTELTMGGTFHGTPQFAPPEQMRGEPLDVRADIYAVGATLYYLLTGRPPFDDKDLMALVTRIATEVPRSPRALAPSVPRDLAAIVLRCLAKDRSARPATYAALTDDLRPFSSTAPTPASLGRRVLAGIIDAAIFFVPFAPVTMYAISGGMSLAHQRVWWSVLVLMGLAYYSVLEGYWGASIGKRVSRLRVTRRDGQRPGFVRALVRALVFQTTSFLASLPYILLGQARWLELAGFVPAFFVWVPHGLLFATARRRNGFCGVHEFVSGTRVVERVTEAARPVLDTALDGRVDPTSPQRIGPYDIVGTLGATDIGVLRVGFDPALRRRVWVRVLPSGASPTAALIRNISRPGRLRWLSGRRTASESWDAYEALDGAPFVSVVTQSRSWTHVKHWLMDLSREIDSSLRDGSLPMLTLDRIWIGGDGHARFLDFRAPGTPETPAFGSATSLSDVQALLGALAQSALYGHASAEADFSGSPRHPTLPLSASTLLDNLATRGFASSQDLVAEIASVMSRPDTVTRWRRTASVALCSAGPALLAMIVFGMMMMTYRIMPPDFSNLQASLYNLARLSSLPREGDSAAARQRAALEVYIAGRFGPTVADEKTWQNPMMVAGPMGSLRPLAERALADHPHVSPDELAEATAALRPLLQAQERFAQDLRTGAPFLGAFMFLGTFGFVAGVGLLGAFVLRGGILMRALGIAVVTRTGLEVSRPRALGRALAAWVPLIALVVFVIQTGVLFNRLSPDRASQLMVLSVVTPLAMLFLGGAMWTALHPERGLQDRIASTWLVPR